MRAVEVLNAHFPAVLDETIPVPTRTNGSNHTVLGGQPGPPEASIVSLTGTFWLRTAHHRADTSAIHLCVRV